MSRYASTGFAASGSMTGRHVSRWSLLSHFNDAEIEAGITEIRQAHPGEEIAFADTLAFIRGVKQ
jgi:hypothetical protein